MSRSDGVVNFIDYETRQFVGYLTDFSTSTTSNLTISHDDRLNIYIISSGQKCAIFDDFTFEKRVEVNKKVLDVGVGLNGDILFLLSSNQILKKDLENLKKDELIEIPEGNLKSLKYG